MLEALCQQFSTTRDMACRGRAADHPADIGSRSWVSETEEETLRSMAGRRTTHQALVWCCEPALCSPARGDPNKWLRGSSEPRRETVCKWRARFVAQLLDGLHDEPRRARGVRSTMPKSRR